MEKVSVLLGTQQANPSIYSRNAYLLPTGVVGSFSLLKRIFGSVIVPEDLVLDGCINLASLWKFFLKQRDNIHSEVSCLECIFILIGGLVFFPNETLTISAYHAELMCISVRNPEKSLSQFVLAFTI